MRCESCIYFDADKNYCEARTIPLESIDPEECPLHTSGGFKMTLFEVELVTGMTIYIDEPPMKIKGDWVTVQTYRKFYPHINSDYHYFQEERQFIIRPSMIVGYYLLENSEVIM